ncbi:hypothetical protein PENSPDRAFT_753382 [Peniophora sp. CONT]|nr:hypothetical protein PENSPDRAFT_753382 [Peniophora sp. CONT]
MTVATGFDSIAGALRTPVVVNSHAVVSDSRASQVSTLESRLRHFRDPARKIDGSLEYIISGDDGIRFFILWDLSTLRELALPPDFFTVTAHPQVAMFSFMKIATFAALAFGSIASAIPAPAPLAEAGALEARTTHTVTDVLTALPGKLAAPCGALSSMTPSTVTPAAVKVEIDLIVAILTQAKSDCGSASGNGSGNLLALLSVVIKLVIGAAGSCYSASGSSIDVQVVLQLLDVCLSGLISTVLNLVLGLLGGILSVVVGLLTGLLGGSCTSIILKLNLKLCISLLGLSL